MNLPCIVQCILLLFVIMIFMTIDSFIHDKYMHINAMYVFVMLHMTKTCVVSDWYHTCIHHIRICIMTNMILSMVLYWYHGWYPERYCICHDTWYDENIYGISMIPYMTIHGIIFISWMYHIRHNTYDDYMYGIIDTKHDFIHGINTIP